MVINRILPRILRSLLGISLHPPYLPLLLDSQVYPYKPSAASLKPDIPPPYNPGKPSTLFTVNQPHTPPRLVGRRTKNRAHDSHTRIRIALIRSSDFQLLQWRESHRRERCARSFRRHCIAFVINVSWLEVSFA